MHINDILPDIKEACAAKDAEIERLNAYVAGVGGFPWRSHRLADWSIVGMNHYRQDGEPRLFVSMEWRGRRIKAEGPDDGRLWSELERQAYLVKETQHG